MYILNLNYLNMVGEAFVPPARSQDLGCKSSSGKIADGDGALPCKPPGGVNNALTKGLVYMKKMSSSTTYSIPQNNGKVNHFFLQMAIFLKEIFHAGKSVNYY